MTTAAIGAGVRQPPRSPIDLYLGKLHDDLLRLREGKVATYIPELATGSPDWFGICLATTDGRVYEVGDTRQTFTIQSISKPFVYGLALEDHGAARVRQKIGVEPTGDAFNSISLTPDGGRPFNPMINAGAIAATSLVAGTSAADRLHRIVTKLSMYAGRRLTIDDAVYRSERETGHRNRAIAHMLRNFDILPSDPETDLDLYFRQCSLLVDCRDLSLMAATLANGGMNPVTGERAIDHDHVERLLSVMTSCGMYDSAGEWIFTIGMPAKSGVAGGVLAVLPGQLGIGVFSPPLDERGNSVRGTAVCQRLSRDLNLHFLRAGRSARSTIRAQATLRTVRSRRVRDDVQRTVLDAEGHRVRVYELQGDLAFPGIEAIVRAIVEASREMGFAIVDLARVTRIEDCATAIFLQLIGDLAEAGKGLVFSSPLSQRRFLRSLEEGLVRAEHGARLVVFPDLDRALEWGEERLISGEPTAAGLDQAVLLPEHRLCRGLMPPQIAHLEHLLEQRTFTPGATIIRRGDPGDHVYLLMRGRVSVTVDLPDGGLQRLSTLSPGMVFGEAAFIDRSPRTADVRAETAVECLALHAGAFDRLGEDQPAIKIVLLENLLRSVYGAFARQTIL